MIPTAAPRSGGGSHAAHNSNKDHPSHNRNKDHHNHNHHYNMARTTACFAGIDANLQLGLVMVFCLYLLVTVGTFSRLPTPTEDDAATSNNSINLVKRARILLHGKMYEPATTSDALQDLIRREEARYKQTTTPAAGGDDSEKKNPMDNVGALHNPHHDYAIAAAQAAARAQIAQQQQLAQSNNPNNNNNNNNNGVVAAAGAAGGAAGGAAAGQVMQQQQQVQQQQVQVQQQQPPPPPPPPPPDTPPAAAVVTNIDMNAIAKVQQAFPLRASDDMEEIDHPGYKYADINKLAAGGQQPPPAKMMVPKYWNPVEYGGDVRKYLGDYGKRLITPSEALSIGSKTADGQETIYITIASYRDPECPITIDSMFKRAEHPHRLKIAVIDQRLEGDMRCIVPTIPCTDDPEQTLCKYSNQIESLEMDARLGIGPVFARHLGYRHYRGEYFAMQVDAHVRFVEHWDTSLVEQWHSAHNEMAVLSTYLSDLNNSIDPLTNRAIRPGRPIMCATDYEGTGKYKHLRHGQQPEGPAMIHGQPTLHPFWAAGFSFARGHFIVQVPYDQYLPMIFQGEEISIGLRGFTFGYDYYTPEKSVCFHMYAMLENKEKRDKVPHFWENTSTYRAAGVKAMQRLNGIIGMGDPADTFDRTEEEKYALGWVRKKEKFFRTFGIHPETQKVEGHLCQFVGQPMQRLFLRAMRDDQMGLDYEKINYEWKDPNPSPMTPAKKK